MSFRYIHPSKKGDSVQNVFEELNDARDAETEYLTSLFITPDHLPLEQLRRLKYTRRNRITLMDLRKELIAKNVGCNIRRLIIIGLIIMILIVLVITVITTILFTTHSHKLFKEQLKDCRISLHEWLGGSLSTKSFNGTWLSGDEIFYEDEKGNLMIFNVLLKKSFEVLNKKNSAFLSFEHRFSADRKYLLLAFNYQKLFRHTYLAHYKIINLETLILKRNILHKNQLILRGYRGLTIKKEQQETLLNENESQGLQLVVWAPHGNALIYVFQNNIYYRPHAGVTDDYEITTNGIFGSIYNGVPDWVYEEEILSSNKAVWFSPSGSKLAFGYFDDTNTPVMKIPFYGYPGFVFQYPTELPVHYPKTGTQNPKVKLFYVDLEKVIKGNFTLFEIECPRDLSNRERILAAVSFPTDNFVSSVWMNRVQNESYVHICDVITQNCTTAFMYEEKNGWVEQFVPPLYNKDGTSFLLILPQTQKNNDDWRHIVLITNITSNYPKVIALTSGLFVVTEILTWDEDNDYVYYLATSEIDPAQKHLYRLSIFNDNKTSDCLSCKIINEYDGSNCLYNAAEFSMDNSHYVLICAGPGVPVISIYDKYITKLYVWEDNKDVTNLLLKKSLPSIKRLTVPVPGNFNAHIKLFLPPNADLSGNTKYPLIVYVYGGPDTNEVTEKFNIDWGTYLVTNKNIIYASIDGRGTGLKGNSMMFAVYRNLGTVEIIDQINVTWHLQNNLSFIDSTKIAIWGWSYGGYATGMVLAMDYQRIFKCGLSVAPVTDWTLYDSIYTERFMGLPDVADNLWGYDQSQLLNKVDNIRYKKFFLIHGTLDDNVHYQQSVLLAKILEQKDILFRQQVYTDETHDIARMRLHLYHSMENFIEECFKSS